MRSADAALDGTSKSDPLASGAEKQGGVDGTWECVCEDVFAVGEEKTPVRYALKPDARSGLSSSVLSSKGAASFSRTLLSEAAFAAKAADEQNRYERIEKPVCRTSVHASVVRLTWESPSRTNALTTQTPAVWVSGKLTVPKQMSELDKLAGIAAQLLAHASLSSLGDVCTEAVTLDGRAKADGGAAALDVAATAGCVQGQLLRGGLGVDHAQERKGDAQLPSPAVGPALPSPAAGPAPISRQKSMPAQIKKERSNELSARGEESTEGFVEQLRLNVHDSAAQRLHEHMGALLDREGKRVPAGHGAGARLERLVACVLLHHHGLMDVAMAVAVTVGSGAETMVTSDMLKRIWQAARKVRKFVAEQLNKERSIREGVERKAARAKAAEAATEGRDDDGAVDEEEDTFDAPAEEERIVAPLETRALFLLRAVQPATLPHEVPSHLQQLDYSPTSAVLLSPTPVAKALSEQPVSQMPTKAKSDSLFAMAAQPAPELSLPRPGWDAARAKLELLLRQNPNVSEQQLAGAVELARASEKRRKLLRKQVSFATSLHKLGTELGRARAQRVDPSLPSARRSAPQERPSPCDSRGRWNDSAPAATAAQVRQAHVGGARLH